MVETNRYIVREDLKDVPKTPLGVSGILLDILKDYFRHNTSFTYSDDPVETKLLISLHQHWDPSDCENYPGIYVKRQNYQMQHATLGNYQQLLNEKAGQSYNFLVPIASVYSIIVVGKEYGEVEVLSSDVGMFLLMFAERIRLEAKFNTFKPSEISATEIMKEDPNYRIASINLFCGFSLSWTLNLEKPLFNGANIKDNTYGNNTTT